MVWLFVPDTAVLNSPSELSPETTSAWLTLSGKPSQRPLSWREWRTRPYIRLLSGTILRPSAAASGVESWILSLRASRANLGLEQVSAKAPTTTVGSGRKSTGLFATLIPSGFSWRTSPDSKTVDSDSSSVIFPSAGSMRNGIVSQRPKSARRTFESGSSSWPTPDASVAGGYNQTDSPGAAKRPVLSLAAKLWPSIRGIDGTKSGTGPNSKNVSLTQESRRWATPRAGYKNMAGQDRRGGDRSSELLLPGQAREATWATPTSRDYKDGQSPSETAPTNGLLGRQAPRMLIDGATGLRALNPQFVERLMGLPPIKSGWTGFMPVETESSLKLQRWRSWSLAVVSAALSRLRAEGALD